MHLPKRALPKRFDQCVELESCLGDLVLVLLQTLLNQLNQSLFMIIPALLDLRVELLHVFHLVKL